MYKSPIEIIQGELHTEMDGAIMKAVQQVGISVNKNELLYALAYDRSQYQLGFIDGKRKAREEIVHCKDCKHQRKLFHADARRKDGGYFIYWCDLVDGYSHVCLDDDYCSKGERREDDDN